VQLGGLFGGLYRITEWITRLAVTNLLWFFSSLPFILVIGLSLLSKDINFAFFMILLGLVIAPFSFFPATAAMFTVARKWVNGDEDTPLFKGYIYGLKDNYKQSMIGGFFYAIAYGIIGFNIRFYSELKTSFSGVLTILFIVILVIVFITMLNFFGFIAHVRLKTRQLFRNAVLLSLGKPGNTLLLIVSILLVGLFTKKFPGIIFFFSGSVIALISFYLFKRAYTKIFGEDKIADEDAFEEA
jgi:uncharacterized membrane protein YesL